MMATASDPRWLRTTHDAVFGPYPGQFHEQIPQGDVGRRCINVLNRLETSGKITGLLARKAVASGDALPHQERLGERALQGVDCWYPL